LGERFTQLSDDPLDFALNPGGFQRKCEFKSHGNVSPETPGRYCIP